MIDIALVLCVTSFKSYYTKNHKPARMIEVNRSGGEITKGHKVFSNCLFLLLPQKK